MITLIRESKFNVGQTVFYMSPFGEPRQAKVRGIKYVQTEGIEQSNNKGTCRFSCWLWRGNGPREDDIFDFRGYET